MPDTTQGSAVAMASSSELLIPSATLGRTKTSAAQEVIRGVGHRAGELDAIGNAQFPGTLGEHLAIAAGSNQDQAGRYLADHERPGVEQERDVLLRVQAAGEDHAGPLQQVTGNRAGPGMKMLCVHAAGHTDDALAGKTQLPPLAFNFRGDGREGGVAHDDPPKQGSAAGAPQLVGLAVITRACRLHKGWNAGQPGAGQPRGDRFPECLVGMDHVDPPVQLAESVDDPRDEAEREERPAFRGADAAMNEDALVVFLVDRVAGDRLGDHVHGVAPAHQLEALCQGLSFGPAGERMEITDDVTDGKRKLRGIGHGRCGPRQRLRDRDRERSSGP